MAVWVVFAFSEQPPSDAPSSDHPQFHQLFLPTECLSLRSLAFLIRKAPKPLFRACLSSDSERKCPSYPLDKV